MLKTWILLAGSTVMFTGILCAQEQPLSVKGTFSSGFYSSYTRGGGSDSQKLQFVPAGAAFDINGYFVSPDLLNLSIQPEVNYGPQASDAGFQGGNGVRLSANLLRRSIFPVTFRYANVQLEDAYFGSLSQLSSYTLKNRNKELGLTGQLNRPNLPAITIDWSRGLADSKSGIASISDSQSSTRHLNVDSRYTRWGWEFQGSAHRQQQASDLFTLMGDGANSSSLQQKMVQYQGTARHSLPWGSEMYLDGGSQSTANVLLNQPIDVKTHYGSANLRLLQRSRWKTSMRAGYTSNITGLFLTQLVGGLSSNGSIAPDISVLQPLHNTISNLTLNALTSVNLWHGLGLYGSADRTAVLVAGNSGLRSSYFTTTGGVTYSKKLSWGNVSGQYGREYGMGSVTGQTGTITGQNYTVSFQHGDRDGIQFDTSVHGTDQSVRNTLPIDNHSFSWDGSVGRRIFGECSVRVGGGWQRAIFTNVGNDTRTKGYTALLGIEHPRLQFTGSLNTSLGNALQTYSQLLGGIGTESALLTPLRLIPSDFRGMSLTLHLRPTRRLEITGLYTRSVQHMEGIVANDFEVIDVHATYPFRKLQFEIGLFRSRQIFSSYLATYPQTERGRLYFRVVRSAKIL